MNIFRKTVIAGILACGLVVASAGAANAATVASADTGAANSASVSDSAANPIKVTRAWKLGPLGSGEAVLGCPDGYGLQWNRIQTPNFGSSNSAISAALAGYSGTAVTLWVTNWNPFQSETTTLHTWCELR